jgi:hypothetical protein
MFSSCETPCCRKNDENEVEEVEEANHEKAVEEAEEIWSPKLPKATQELKQTGLADESQSQPETASPSPSAGDKADEVARTQATEIEKTAAPVVTQAACDESSQVVALPYCCRIMPSHTLPAKEGVSRALRETDYKMMKDFVACVDGDGWRPMTNFFGARTTKKFMKHDPGSPQILIKGVSPVKAKASDIFELFSDPAKFQESMKIIDPMFIAGKVMEVPDAHHVEIHAQFKAPPGITNRDFCYEAMHAMVDAKTAFCIGASIKRPDCPPSTQTWKWVRGEIKVSGYLVRNTENGDGCVLTYIVQVDPSGWVPTWVVNLVAGDQADNVTRIARYFDKISQKRDCV